MALAIMFEDEDDFHLVTQVARRLGLRLPEPSMRNLKGYNATKLRAEVKSVLNTDYERLTLVLVLDADRAPEGGPIKRWGEVVKALRGAGIDIPQETSTADGLVLDVPPHLRVAVWLFPDCVSEGAMEDFVLQKLVPGADPLLGHAESVVDALPHRLFRDHHRSKAWMRSWLAWQEIPGLPPGRAVSVGTLDARPEAEHRVGTFAQWLRRAFA
jgi:hypothetical protein